MQPRLEIPVLKPGAQPTVLRRGSLPAPLHLRGALARYPHLTLAQRLSAARAALALAARRDTAASARALDGETSATGWRVTARAREAWGAVGPDRAADAQPARGAGLAALGAFVFREGLLSRADAGDIGFHRAPLSETIGDPAARALARAGVEVRLGWRAETLVRSGVALSCTVAAAGAAADALGADAVVVALPHARAAALIEELLGDVAVRLRAAELADRQPARRL